MKTSRACGLGELEVPVQRGEFVLLGAAGVELPDVAHKDDLEGRHQRGRLCAVEHFEDGRTGQVKVGKTEVAQVRRSKRLQEGGAAAIL